MTGAATVAAVVLAAGGGSRWDGPGHKLLALVDGVPLACHAIQAALDASLDELVVVTGAVDLLTEEVIPPGATVLVNEKWASGQASSLQLAIDYSRRAGHDAVVVGLADSPGIPAEAWKAVSEAESPLAIATFSSHRCPPTRIGRDLWNDLPTEGDEGARSLLSLRSDLVLEVACTGDPTDVDTMEDLGRWS